jgi:hypothetical protein
MQQPDRLTVVFAHRDPFLSAGLACHLGNLAEFDAVVSGLELDAAITGSDSGDVVVTDYDSGLRFLGPDSRWRDRVLCESNPGLHGTEPGFVAGIFWCSN